MENKKVGENMIYELKVELFGGEFPVTRILHVNSEINFKQLHYIIQTAFDWSGLRPHIFLVHERTGSTVFHEIRINLETSFLFKRKAK